jgi:hypothetical protein
LICKAEVGEELRVQALGVQVELPVVERVLAEGHRLAVELRVLGSGLGVGVLDALDEDREGARAGGGGRRVAVG